MLLDSRSYYKPFEYPWAYEAWKQQQEMFWMSHEINMSEDILDWNYKISDSERNLLVQIFRFFTQADLDVLSGYTSKYPVLFQKPEIRMMLTAFANMETIHVDAYSVLIDTLSLPETEYAAFLEYEEMNAKHEYLKQFNTNSSLDIAKTLAVYGAFTEGLQLFSSFAILLNFPRDGKLKGMGQIVSLSIRDENLHTTSIIKLFNTFVSEYNLRSKELTDFISLACQEIVANEDRFIDISFGDCTLKGLEKDDVKKYIRYVADVRLKQLGIPAIYNIDKNPLPWVSDLINTQEHANFFESTPTEYAKATTGDWSDVKY